MAVLEQFEQYYSIKDVASRLGMSFERTRLLIMDEPGVLHVNALQKDGSKAKRTMYRIPASVIERLLRRLAEPEPAQLRRGL